MKEIRLEIKKLLYSRGVQIVFFSFLLVAVLDPISVVLQDISWEGNLIGEIGKNPFQFWLLLNSVSWGNHVYNTMFWVIAVLLTGQIFYQEQKSFMLTAQIVRIGKKPYFFHKIIATALVSFVSTAIILSINVIVTLLLFWDWTAHSSYYNSLVPEIGTFASALYQKSPILMMFGYVLLNAVAIGIFAVFSLAVQTIFHFPNLYVAILSPVVILYLISFVLDAFPVLFHFNIRLLLQPMAATALTEILSWEDLILTFGIWIAIDAFLILIGLRRNQEVMS